ncbi:hypothetical protein [Nocardia sp. NPDC050406]|uniref:hypothetical protein n=1 Tax=Nocardia sp. NPDC050406 TaxID=3364318 RepID=UPI0037A85FA6
MSDQNMPGRGAPGTGGHRFDAVERLRRKLEGSPDTGDRSSKLIRLPRRPRRTTEEVNDRRPHQAWLAEGINEPPPTRPVLRSELVCETGWLVTPGPATPKDAAEGTGNDADVIDFGASRRKRAGDDAPVGRRRMARPRRIRPATDSDQDPTSHGDADRPRPEGPA